MRKKIALVCRVKVGGLTVASSWGHKKGGKSFWDRSRDLLGGREKGKIRKQLLSPN